MKSLKSWSLHAAWLIAGVSLLATECIPDEVREWKGKKGKTVKASFVKTEDGYVYLELENGNVVQALEENLCDEDRQYVLEKSYVPRDIEVSFGMGSTGYLKEDGKSPVATFKDTITFKVNRTLLDGSVRRSNDSRWKYISSVIFEGKMSPVKPDADGDLKSEGKFVQLKFSVENDSALPVAAPPPLLIDQRNRRYLPLDDYRVDPYIPEGFLNTESDIVQPGFKKKFCVVYEVPPQVEIHALEIFPVKAQAFLVRQLSIAGKRIHVKLPSGDQQGVAAPAVLSDADTAAAPAAPKGPADFNVFLKCTRLSQGGGKASGYYYDYNKKRSLAYGVELRTTSKKPENLLVKAFFIGKMSTGKDVVVDKKEASVELDAGRIERISLQSEEISENAYFYYGSSSSRTSAKLEGVIIQVWRGKELLKGFSSLSQWKRHETSERIVEELGELRRSYSHSD